MVIKVFTLLIFYFVRPLTIYLTKYQNNKSILVYLMAYCRNYMQKHIFFESKWLMSYDQGMDGTGVPLSRAVSRIPCGLLLGLRAAWRMHLNNHRKAKAKG